MTDLRPAVSICIPVYNGSHFLERCFASIAAQTWQDFEIIVVDDGSQDDSAGNARRLMAHYGISGQVIRTENHGCEQARDVACDAARADVIAPFDCDDLWEPEYLAHVLAALRSHPDIDFVYCDSIEVFADTGAKKLKSEEAHWIDLTRASRDGDLYRFGRGEFFAMLLRGQVLFPPCTMFKRSLYGRAGRYADLDLRISLDWSFGLRASRVGTVAFLNQPLLRKFNHGANVSGDPVRTLTSDLKVIRSLLDGKILAPGERAQVKGLAAARAAHISYAMRTTHRNRLQALKWSLASFSYAPNLKAVKLMLTALMPRAILDRRRAAA
jgi:alpha-1,6-rhamnosyltransferase